MQSTEPANMLALNVKGCSSEALTNDKMSSTALSLAQTHRYLTRKCHLQHLTALKAHFLEEKYHSRYFFLAITHGLLMKNIGDGTFSNSKHR